MDGSNGKWCVIEGGNLYHLSVRGRGLLKTKGGERGSLRAFIPRETVGMTVQMCILRASKHLRDRWKSVEQFV